MRILLSSIGISLVLSVLAAMAADFWLSPEGGAFGAAYIPVLGTFAGLRYTLNPGIAWGIQLPGGLQELLICIALFAVLWMGIQSQKTHSNSISSIGYGIVVGGGFANIIDRFLDGTVTDYIQIGTFPVFNVADSFVTIGVVMLLLESILSRKALHNS